MVKVYLLNSYFTNINEQNITGSDKFAIDLIKKDIENNEEVHVIAPNYFFPLIKDAKVKFHNSGNYVSVPLIFGYFFRTFIAINFLSKIKKGGIVISCSDFFVDVLPAFVSRKNLSWYAFTYHLYPKALSFRSLFGRFLQLFSYFLFQGAERVFVTNEICENFLKKNFRIKNTLKIHLGLKLQRYFSINQTPKHKGNLLFVGRFKESKGFFEVPDILNSLSKSYPNFYLYVIGSGSDIDIQVFRKKLEEYDLDKKVQILTKLSDDEVLKYFEKADVLIHPSFEEGFSLTICEALASNLKVCAYNLPIYKEIYGDFKIQTCKIHNVTSFAKNIEKCLISSHKTNYPIEFFEDFDFDKTYNLIFT